MTSAAWALQQAVFAVLSCDGAVSDLIDDRLFDAVPRGSAFPYVVIGDGAETADAGASEHTLSLHVWSRGGGHREAKQIASALREALEGTPLSLDGHSLVNLAFQSADYARLADGETWRATLRFRAVTEPEEET